MVRTLSAALAGLMLSGLATTTAVAGNAWLMGYPAHPYHALYPAEVAPYAGSVRKPFVLGRQGPRIAMTPARFHSYPYVSTFDSCFRWHRTRHGRHHRVWVCG